MAKARARAAARKVKDKWKAKNWYQVLAPPLFDNVPIAETLADRPHVLINRVTELSLQDITNDFRKSHIKLFFKIHKVEESNARTQFVGHTLTSDYLRRMIRRRRSRIDGVYDVATRDGAYLRVKPFATTDKRIQNSQKKLIRDVMRKTILDAGKTKTLNEFIKDILEGKTGSDIYKNCKNLYPVKRIEVHKTEVIRQPTVEVEKKKPAKKEEPEPEKPEEKKEKKKLVEKKKTEKPEAKEEKAEEPPAEKPKKEKTAEKPTPKEKAAKEPKKPAKKTTKPKTPPKKTTAKSKATKKTAK